MLCGASVRNSTPANSRSCWTPARTAGDTANAMANAVAAATSARSQVRRFGLLISARTCALMSGGSGTCRWRPRSRRASDWSSIMGHLLRHRAQSGERSGQPGLHGSLGEAQGLRGLGLAQVEQVPARDDLPVALAQALQG